MTQEAVLSTSVLDDSYKLLQRKKRTDTAIAMQQLATYLMTQKKALPPNEWTAFTQIVQTHPINNLLREAPQFAHSQTWPRGYKGDAEMMDLIYGMGNNGQRLARTSALGLQINAAQEEWPTHQAAHRRLKKIAQTIDTVAHEKPGKAAILSVACGHLREIVYSHAAIANLIGQWIALDQDEKSLALIQKSYQHVPIQCQHQSIASLLKGEKIGKFDLIYAAGLYDYLKVNTAKKLTETLFDNLQPGGRLLIANFTPNTKEMGILESLMDWTLIYRDMKDMAQLTTGISQHKAAINIYNDLLNSNNRLVYLEVKRKIA